MILGVTRHKPKDSLSQGLQGITVPGPVRTPRLFGIPWVHRTPGTRATQGCPQRPPHERDPKAFEVAGSRGSQIPSGPWASWDPSPWPFNPKIDLFILVQNGFILVLGRTHPRPMGQGRWASRTPAWGCIQGPEADGPQ